LTITGKPGAKASGFLFWMDTIPAMKLELTADEALVLFDLLTRTENAGSIPTKDSAENRVLEMLLCKLEKEQVAPFGPDYDSLLEKARSRIRRAWGS
jgi:hypothetical protein